MTTTLVVAPLLVALATAILALPTRRWPRVQRAVSLLGILGYATAVSWLVMTVFPSSTFTYQVGDWPAPFGITLVADPLSVFMLALTAAVAVPALVYGLRAIDDPGQRLSFHALYHFMLVGVTGAFLTGDLFNLFVWFEVMLMASYVLVVFESDAAATGAAFVYLVLNLVGSAVMLVAVGGIYAVTGTLNMADVARRLAHAQTWGIDPAPVVGLALLLFAVFALKAGLAPFQFWVPPAYEAAPTPVAAMLAGVVKKVGVYAIIRLYFTVVAPATVPLDGGFGEGATAVLGPVLLVMATASIVVGALGAIDGETIEELLAYSSISQIGFVVLPVAVGAAVPAVRRLAVAAALIYALNHALAKSALFLVAGTIGDATGTTRFADLGGLTGRTPVVATTFLLGSLALVGIPPLSGFFGKLLVFDVAVQASADPALAVALGGAVLTIAYLSRAWTRGFWGTAPQSVSAATPDRVLLGTAILLIAGVVAVGIGFDPVYRAATHAANAALDPHAYVEAVLGPDAWTAQPGGEGA
ncbi:MAG: complex I subunit 5 family protein [Halobacteriaceae archaeon]